jgi:hypothetical protein
VTVGDIIATVTNSSNTSVSFTFPPLTNGTYPINIYVDGIGYAYPTIYASTLLWINSISTTSGSSVGNII